MFFTFLKPVLIFLLVPSIRTILEIIFVKTFGGFLYIEAAFFIFLSLIAEFRRKSLSLSLFEDFIIIKKGFYFKSEYKVKKEKIISVHIRQNIIERLFRAETVFINTFSDKNKGYTLKITVSVPDAEKIRDSITMEIKAKEKGFSLLRIIAFSLASSGSVEGLLFLVPIIRRILKFLGFELYSEIIAKIIGNTKFDDQYMPHIINAVTLVVVFIFLLGFLYQFFKNINFKIITHKKICFIKSGFITKRESIIKTKEIRGIIAEQALPFRILQRFALKAAVGGNVGRFLTNGVIAPFLTEKELKENVKDFFKEDLLNSTVIQSQKAPKGIFSVVLLPLSLFVLLFLVCLCFFLKLDNIRRFVALIFILSSVILFFYAEILIYSYRKGKIILNKNILFIGTKRLKLRRIYINPQNIGEIRIKENPFDRKRGSCKVYVSVFSKSNNTVSLRWLKRKEVIEKLINKV